MNIKFLLSTVLVEETINNVELHPFPDASNNKVLAAVFTLVNQESGTNESLPGYKIKVAKKCWQWQNWN